MCIRCTYPQAAFDGRYSWYGCYIWYQYDCTNILPVLVLNLATRTLANHHLRLLHSIHRVVYHTTYLVYDTKYQVQGTLHVLCLVPVGTRTYRTLVHRHIPYPARRCLGSGMCELWINLATTSDRSRVYRSVVVRLACLCRIIVSSSYRSNACNMCYYWCCRSFRSDDSHPAIHSM